MNHFLGYLLYSAEHKDNLNIKKKGTSETSEQQLINAFTAVSSERPLISYMSNKKRRSMTQMFLKVYPKDANILDVV